MSTPESNSAIHANETSPLEGENTAAREVAATASSSSSATWWRIADFGVLCLWAAIVLFTIPYHEKWADEAQAWLLARDVPLGTLWFHELRYEGSPGLWHTILWVAQHVFHAPYGAISYIGAAFAAAGVAVLLFATPFPRPIRWLMAFSFFVLYQYAVIARSYVLFALFCFIAVRQYRDLERPLRLAIALVPLALLTAHGSLLAIGLALAYATRFIQQWRNHNDVARRDFWFSVALVAIVYVCLFLVLLPPPDVEATHTGGKLIATVVWHRMLRGIREALVDNDVLSLLAILVFAGWSYLRRAFTSFIVPVALVLALYVYADGWEHQSGTIFFAMMAGLAISWPDDEERNKLDGRMRLGYGVMVATLSAVLCYQVYAAFYTIRRDVKLPYSGAEDTAHFLKPLVAEGKTIDGYQYGMVAVNAYFDLNIFSNLSRAYYHHSLSEFDPMDLARRAREGRADYIVMQWWAQFDPKLFKEGLADPLEGWGYTLDHVSDGYLLTKAGYSHRQIFLIFRRVKPSDVQTPPLVSPHR